MELRDPTPEQLTGGMIHMMLKEDVQRASFACVEKLEERLPFATRIAASLHVTQALSRALPPRPRVAMIRGIVHFWELIIEDINENERKRQ